MIRLFLALALALAAACAPGLTWAAHSYGNCNGYVDSLPATITTAGTWCLRSNQLTSQESGAAITVAADHVILDCNDFRISGLSAGQRSLASGIVVPREHHHVTVRNCQIIGFRNGVAMLGFSHLVERNMIDASTYTGIFTRGSFNVVRGNLVRDTGGWLDGSKAFGIVMHGEFSSALDNTVAGVSALDTGVVVDPLGSHSTHHDTFTYGIIVQNGLVQGNRVLGLEATATGIQILKDGVVMDNILFHGAGKGSVGINGGGARCEGNVVVGYKHRFKHCVGGPEG